MVRKGLALTMEDQLVTQEGLVILVGRCIKLFYTDNGVMVSRDLEWIQGALNVIIGLFCRSSLVTNVAKSKTMT